MIKNVYRLRPGKGRNRTWASAHHREWQRRKQRRERQFVIVAALVVAFTFSAVFFWPAGVTGLTGYSAALMGKSGASVFTCRVSSITDGDTFRCSDGTRVRLHAVAARESDETCSPGHPCPEASGARATAKLTELASGQTLQCEQIGTSYNRITAICRNEAKLEINCAMVMSGTTVIWPKFDAQRSIC